MNNMFDVISIGTATYDVFLKSDGLAIGNSKEKNICVSYGAKLEVSEIFFDYGGGGTNTAVTFARQGLNVASIVQVGKDDYGNKIQNSLSAEGVEASLIDKHEGYTDYSTVLWVSDGGRTILVYRGETSLQVEDIDWSKVSSKWFYVSSLEGNLNIVKELTTRFPESNIMWNPGNRELKQKEEVLNLLSKIKILSLNKEEMMDLLNIDSFVDISPILKGAEKLSCEYIVITDDKEGSYLLDRKNSGWIHCGIFIDSPRVETTGAGDSYGSGLLTGFIKNLSLEDSLFIAASNASSVVEFPGAKKGILRSSELTNWKKEKLALNQIKTS